MLDSREDIDVDYATQQQQQQQQQQRGQQADGAVPCRPLSVNFRCINTAHTHTHTHLTAFFPGLPGWAGTRKVKPIWILLKQETVSGSGISWAIMQVCTSLQTDNHASTSPLSFFTGRMPFLPPNQEHQSTEGNTLHQHNNL